MENDWLDVRVPPLRERLADALWSPDELVSYCWRCGSGERVMRAVTTGGAPAPQSVRGVGVDEHGCAICRGVSIPWDRAVRLGRYEGALKSVIRDVKFDAWRSLGTQLGRLMGERLFAAIQAELRTGALAESLLRDDDGRPRQIEIIPVPTSRWHRMQRGIDHTLVLSRGVASALRREGLAARVCTVLAREHRPAQPLVRASERERNVAGSMRVSRPWMERAHELMASWPRRTSGRSSIAKSIEPMQDVQPRLRVVVDDIRTTGATLKAACRALRANRLAAADRSGAKAGARAGGVVWVLAAAVAESVSYHAGEEEEPPMA